MTIVTTHTGETAFKLEDEDVILAGDWMNARDNPLNSGWMPTDRAWVGKKAGSVELLMFLRPYDPLLAAMTRVLREQSKKGKQNG